MIVAVIIPYYQKRAGILQRALQSVLAQKVPADVRVEVIVVDDGSPVPAEAEASALTFSEPYHLTIVKQANGGVSAARNTALSRAPQQTDYIAFLDSDDIWLPGHLATALAGLERGCDFYFCDGQRLNLEQSSFAEKKFADYVHLQGKPLADGVWELSPEPFLERAISERMFYTPTAVFRRRIAPNLRFDTALRVAGEDCLFFFDILGKCRRVCCSTRKLVDCGEGINIHAGKYSWDDPGHLILYLGKSQAFSRIKQRLPLSPVSARFVARRVTALRRLFTFLTVRYFLKHRTAWPHELREMVRNEPHFLLWYLPCAVYVALGYALRFYNPLLDW